MEKYHQKSSYYTLLLSLLTDQERTIVPGASSLETLVMAMTL
jgi:hypothetical protein